MKICRAIVLAAVLVATQTGTANAYPYFQLSSGSKRCNQCHFAPAGGGVLREWGRDEAGDTISRGGTGALLHGVFVPPEWLQIGGDVRLAALLNDTGSSEGTETALFPMQADLALRIASGAFSIMGSAGFKSAARTFDPQTGSERMEASASSYLISREHFLMWQKKPRGVYARLGRFYAPFGLRLPDHTSYVRRYAGFNLLEETYGLSVGTLSKSSELHITAHISDPLRWAPRSEIGATAMYERRSGRLVYGVSSRVGFADNDSRILLGTFAKHWWESSKVLWMVELDVVRQVVKDVIDGDRLQLLAYIGPTWIPTKGVYVGVAYELFDEDLTHKSVERHAATLSLSVFPRAHFEIMLASRVQIIGTDDRALMTMLQVHYYP